MPNSSIRVGQTIHCGAEIISWLQDYKYLFPLTEDSLTQSSSQEVMQNIRKPNFPGPSHTVF